MKYCHGCRTIRKSGEFHKNMSKIDGLQTLCKRCRANRAKQNAESKSEYDRQHYLTNRDEILLYQKTYGPDHKIEKAEYDKQYRKDNTGKRRAWNAKRKAAKKQRTPQWLSKEQLAEIEELYILAKELQWLSEEQLQVDHIVPLQGENVSGLHVPWNLQILPGPLNRLKHNKLLS